MVNATRIHMTATEFFQLPEDQHPIQLLQGSLISVPPPVPDHQRTVRRLLLLLETLIPDGEVFTSPIALYLDDENVPEPDVVWVSAAGKCEVKATRLEGAPELIIEVLSPSTARYDKSVKLLLYEKYGVREYWLADPILQQIEVWRLDDSEYVLHGTYGIGDEFVSAVLGDKIVRLSDIFHPA